VEHELRLQVSLADQEARVLRRKLSESLSDNDNLLRAVEYLRSKLEQRGGVSSTSRETRTTTGSSCSSSSSSSLEYTEHGAVDSTEVHSRVVTAAAVAREVNNSIQAASEGNERRMEGCTDTCLGNITEKQDLEKKLGNYDKAAIK